MNKRILLVEDNEGDIVLTLKAFEKVNVHNIIDVVRDGEKALQFLNKENSFKDAETPSLILLDINLPKVNGKEVLAYLKLNTHLRLIPVVMLTTSDAERDIVESYYNYANCFITKPADFNVFMDMIQTLKDFWIKIVQIPDLN